MLLTLAQATLPPTNPGYLGVVPKPLLVVSMNPASSQGVYTLNVSSSGQLWLFLFDFDTHPEIYQNSRYGTAVSYVDIAPLTSPSLVAASNSRYGNKIGVILTGGKTGTTYTLTVGLTLDNTNILTYSQRIYLG